MTLRDVKQPINKMHEMVTQYDLFSKTRVYRTNPAIDANQNIGLRPYLSASFGSHSSVELQPAKKAEPMRPICHDGLHISPSLSTQLSSVYGPCTTVYCMSGFPQKSASWQANVAL